MTHQTACLQISLLIAAAVLATVLCASAEPVERVLVEDASDSDFVEEDSVWGSGEEGSGEEKQGGVAQPEPCGSLLVVNSQWAQVLPYINNSEFGPFLCVQVWRQEMGRDALWLRGLLGSNLTDSAVHIAMSTQNVFEFGNSDLTDYGGDGNVTFAAPTEDIDTDSSDVVAYPSTQEMYANKYEFWEVVSLSEDEDTVNAGNESTIPDEVKYWKTSSNTTDLVEVRPAMGLGYIEPTKDQLLETGWTWTSEPTVLQLSQMPEEYDFTYEYLNASANEIKSQGSCGSR